MDRAICKRRDKIRKERDNSKRGVLCTVATMSVKLGWSKELGFADFDLRTFMITGPELGVGHFHLKNNV